MPIIKLLSHLRGSLLHCFPEEGGSLMEQAISTGCQRLLLFILDLTPT